MKEPKGIIFQALEDMYSALDRSLGEPKHKRGITTPLLAFITEKAKLPITKQALQHPPSLKVVKTFNTLMDSLYNDAVIWCKRNQKTELPLKYFVEQIELIKKQINRNTQ